jgi:DNA-binding CsgD family transcriptional regulator
MICRRKNNLLFLSGSKLFFIAIQVLFSSLLYCQTKNVGLPFINNFAREEYNAGTQNWSITQDEDRIMYFGNNNGVLRFDGTNWQLFPLPNNSVVRTVLYSDGKVYAGGYEEFGFFSYDKFGDFIYTSLSSKLENKERNFDEIWRIYNTSYGVVFQSFKAIFILKDEKINKILPKSQFGFSYFIDNNLFVIDRKFGMYILQGISLKPFFLDEKFFDENEVSFIFSSTSNAYLIGTINKGVFVYDGQKLSRWNIKANELFIKNQIFSALKIKSTQLAFGTIQNGVFILNEDGEIVQHINRFTGLQNNTVLSMFYDKDENLWLGLDNGIDLLEISSPLSILNYTSNVETSYTSIVHNNILYIGTNQGLFARDIRTIDNENLIGSGFRLIEGTKGQVWKLKVIGDELICGHNLGTFLIKNYQAVQISDIQGGWDFVTVPTHDNYMIGGTYSGLVLYKKKQGLDSGWESLGLINGLSESCRDLTFDNNGNLWVAHGYKGLFKLELAKDFSKVTKLSIYNNTRGLPKLPYTFAEIRQRNVIIAPDGIYVYNESNDTFLLDEELNALFGGNKELSRVYEDYFGDVWFFTNKEMGVYRLQEDGKYTKINIPFHRISGHLLSNGFENIYTYNNKNVFIGAQKGMLHYNPEKLKVFDVSYKTFLSAIKIGRGQTDSIINNLFGIKSSDLYSKDVVFPFKYNSISFSFISPFYEASQHTQYSYRLKGFENYWSDWNNRNVKEYTNLHEGDYTFEVKAKNVYNKESEINYYSFTIKPPLFRSVGAYILYLAILILIIFLNIIYFKRRIEKAHRIEKVKHERVLMSKVLKFNEEAKQSEEQIEKLKNDKLKINVRHKNMELANVTMHLVQKNKFLSKLKGDLMKMWGEAKVESVRYDIKQIIKKIDKDFKSEQQWNVFDKYFDEVHQDFIAKLKETHPVLTPNDLRLCAYLKMNLSTKEIAPLMNISIRGLEISRYRLRKKLDLDRDVNLTEYILNF